MARVPLNLKVTTPKEIWQSNLNLMQGGVKKYLDLAGNVGVFVEFTDLDPKFDASVWVNDWKSKGL